MTTSQQNNKRIAKNTLLLYFRMLLLMVVSLYTSRVTLAALGVEDYGIYNVVGGVVAMFSVLSGSLSSAISRFITFELGRGDKERLKTVFSTSVNIQIGLALIIMVLAEIGGVWFLNYKMNIASERLTAANWVLQCSILTFMVNLISVPYNAAIIAHERMSAFAYISILEAVFKLLVVYLLYATLHDRLIVYAILLCSVAIILRLIYGVYCKRHFEECTYHFVYDKSVLKNMAGFAGWSLFGHLSSVLYTHGLNLLLNVFFGATTNAARAIAVQVQNAIQQFVGNFQTALNPQITKTYAHGDLKSMHNLMFRSARFSFLLLFILSLPVLFETDFILEKWLGQVPENTTMFLRLMICVSLMYTVANPLMIANQATGKVKRYQSICGSVLLTILPISYVCLLAGLPAYVVFVVHLCVETITQCIRMVLLRPLIGICIMDYFHNIYNRVLSVAFLSTVTPYMIYSNMDKSFMRFILICISSSISIMIASYFIGFTRQEKIFVRTKFITIVKNGIGLKI